MASIQQRGATWRVQILKGGKRVSATFDTIGEARAWARDQERALMEGGSVPPAVRNGLTVEQLFSRYAATESPKKRGCRWERVRLLALARDFELFRRPLEEFTTAALVEWRAVRMGQVSAYTVSRELSLMSAVIKTAMNEWQIPEIKVNPVRSVTRPALPRARKQRVPAEALAAIKAALLWDGESEPSSPQQWTAFAFALAVESAMRKGEILAITWQHVHLEERFIHLPETKNGNERDVPLSSRSLALIRLLKPGRGAARMIPVHSGYLDQIMRAARKKAGLLDMRFHDGRREATTNISRRVSNVLELAEITGHQTLDVLKRYYRPGIGYLADKLG